MMDKFEIADCRRMLDLSGEVKAFAGTGYLILELSAS
jgi:hypothetical protein